MEVLNWLIFFVHWRCALHALRCLASNIAIIKKIARNQRWFCYNKNLMIFCNGAWICLVFSRLGTAHSPTQNSMSKKFIGLSPLSHLFHYVFCFIQQPYGSDAHFMPTKLFVPLGFLNQRKINLMISSPHKTWLKILSVFDCAQK